jgi:hypothetical protein
LKRLLLLILACGCSGSVRAGVEPIVGCQGDSDCQYGFYCQGGGCQQAMRSCQASSDCVVGETCRPNPAPGCADASVDLDCPAANLCLPANEGFCCPCQTDADCALGGYCVTLDAGTVCTSSCTPIGCPSGSRCGAVASLDGGLLATCIPDDATCPTSGLSCN